MKKAPILYLLLPFIAGIILCKLWPIVSVQYSAIIACATLLASVITLVIPLKRHYLSSILFILGTLSLGYCDLLVHQPEIDTQHYVHHIQNESPNKRAIVLLTLKEPAYKKGRSTRALAEVIAISPTIHNSDNCWIKSKGKIQLYFSINDSTAASLRRGDTLISNIRFQIPQKFSKDFDYPAYLRNKGILYTSYLTNDYYAVIHNQHTTALSHIDNFRHALMEQIRQQDLSTTQQNIASAMLLGRSSFIDSDTREQFQASGITHLLCVSGLHVGIIAFLIEGLLFFLRRGPRYRVLIGTIQILSIWFFVLLTGMAPSTLRAGIMFSFVIIGRMLWTQSPSIASIAFSATLLLVINPALVFDVGFQLSYSAVVGIALLYSPLAHLINFHPKKKPSLEAYPKRTKVPTAREYLYKEFLWLLESAWKLLCLSFTAQLATLPFILYYFHEFPTYFLISNLLVVPLATFIMATILLTVLLSWWPPAATLVCKVLKLELWWVEAVTHEISTWTHSTLRVSNFTIADALLVAAAVIVLGLIIRFLSKKGSDVIKN